MFVEIFQWLPLFAIINNAVFVVHGGLFHCQDATMEELNTIDRHDFSIKDIPEEGDNVDHMPRSDKSNFLKQLQRDALWSDPIAETGALPSLRGDPNDIRIRVHTYSCINIHAFVHLACVW